jgi:URI fold toxin 2
MHGNSKQNKGIQHLYEIRDKETDDIFKYGISGDPIGSDDLSKRIRNQLTLYNLVAGWKRYHANIIIRDIPDRITALALEEDYIEAYKQKFGRRPIGNPER